MELYFKQLISKDASLEKLVDDLECVVQGVDDFAKAIGADLNEHSRTQVARRLHRLEESCARIRLEIQNKARATDKLVRRSPYRFLIGAVLVGAVIGFRLGMRR